MSEISEQQVDPFSYPSIVYKLPFEDYLNINALNSHGIYTIHDKSALHFKLEKEDEREQSASMKLGTLFHELTLEPWANRYRVSPKGFDKTTNVNKAIMVRAMCEWLECDPPEVQKQAEGKMLSEQIDILSAMMSRKGLYAVTEEQHYESTKMRDNLMANPQASAFFADGNSEVTLLWRCPNTGIKKKARVDWLPYGHYTLVDLKTIDSAGTKDCERAATRFGYDFQMLHYEEGARETGLSDRPFTLFFAERKRPYMARAWFILDNNNQLRGTRKIIGRVCELYAEAIATGVWPGFSEDIEPLKLPGRAFAE